MLSPDELRERYAALLDAYVSGSTTVTYGGKSMQYRSAPELRRAIVDVRRALGLPGGNNRTTVLKSRNPNIPSLRRTFDANI